MTDIDKISEKIGQFGNAIRSIEKNTEKTIDILQETTKEVILQGAKIDAAHSRLDDVEPQVRKHNSLLNKGLGYIAAVTTFMATVSGAIGASIAKFFF